ncbi:MAG: HNH endonuclease [Rhodospirillales bacterium]|jgi:putative restriction endonuclease|nr:HNH endonuclease [Rhodospirillales bacterium]
MTRAVFTTKVDSSYDDLPEIRYHFPRTYLRAAERAVGDWIVYYEPRRTSGDLSSRGGRQAYFATARVTTIEPDSIRPDHFYALVTDYLELDHPVPFKEGEHYYESSLRRVDGGTSKGAFGRAVRLLADHEYDLILQAGFATLLAQTIEAESNYSIPGVAEEPATFERPIIESVVARPFREAAFARHVKAAYDNTCAITGIKLINGGGRAEVQAAHIRPVHAKGPDSIRNGIALSGTVHWMFDRGLISIDDDYTILVARDRVPDTVLRLINSEGCLSVPPRPDRRPHPQFLRYHRHEVFKG